MINRSNKDKAWKKISDYRAPNELHVHYNYLPLKYAGTQTSITHEPINDITLHKNGDAYELILHIDPDAHRRLSEFFEGNGYPKCRPIWRDKKYSIQIPNVKYLEDFLRVTAVMHDDIRLIANDLVAAFKPYSKEEPTIPGWLKHTGKDQVTYYSSAKNQKYRFITLSYTAPNESMLGVKTKKKSTGVHGLFFYNQPRSTYLKIDSLETLKQTLEIISAKEPEVAAIADSLIDAYCKKNGTSNISPEAQYNIDGERIDSPKP